MFTLKVCSSLLAGLLIAGCATDTARNATPDRYLHPGEIDLTQLLSPPPARGSAAERAQVDAVRSAQQNRSPASAARASADGAISVFVFNDVLGPKFVPDRLPLTVAFFANVSRATTPFIFATKECWHTPRPFELDRDITPAGNLQAGVATRPGTAPATVPSGPGSPCAAPEPAPQYSYSYPSGHATFGTMTAILLANMVPEQRSELHARGWEYGENRIIGGVHYPKDVEGGRIQATVLVALMLQNVQFKTDFAAARAELRGVLGLP